MCYSYSIGSVFLICLFKFVSDQASSCHLQDGGNIVKKMKGVFAFKVKGAGGKEGVWVVDVKNGKGSVKFGSNGEKAAVS